MDKRQLGGLCAALALALAATACERPAPPPAGPHGPAYGTEGRGGPAPGGTQGERHRLARPPAPRTIRVAFAGPA